MVICMNKEPKRILIVLTSLILMFLSLIVYLTGFQIFKAEKIKNNPYNKRTWIKEEEILRGEILDRNGDVLAYSEKVNGLSKRVYNYGDLYSHVIGYSNREYGKSGLELQYDNILLDDKVLSGIEEIKDALKDEKKGNNLKSTLDHGMQLKSKELLGNKKGAIIAMNPKTGEIYSMISSPGFNSNNLKENWKDINNNPNSPLLNRVTQGAYSPGSAFKILTAASILENNIDQEFNCEGKIVIDGYTFKDYNQRGHGQIDLKTAITKSCNTYFAKKSVELGKNKMGQTAEDFLMNKEIEFDLGVRVSNFPYKDKMGQTDLAASGMGQGKIQITPLNMALITSGIVNEGEINRPVLVKEILNTKMEPIEIIKTKLLNRAMSSKNANILKDMMKNVVIEGTGTNANISGYEVGGKTGTAENASGRNHAWWTGFVSSDNKDIVVTVVLEEDGGTGGSSAAPLAREIMKYGIENIK